MAQHNTDASADRPTDYIFRTASDLGHPQMQHLETLLDEPTMGLLDGAGPQPGWRCLELGAGGGSIARWLAERVAPGRVVATDLDTDYLTQFPGVEVHRHDINNGLPVEGPFDLIHARLVLMHLPRRLEILATLVDALAPGGWLVLGDFGSRLPHAISAPKEEDHDLFDRLLEVGHGTVGPAAGQSLEWAHEAGDHMESAGLAVDRREHSSTVVGGDVGASYLHNLMTQIGPLLLQAGLTETELTRCRELTLDPQFCARFYQFVGTRGQKPTGDPS